jgi:hypothetical protein
MGGTPRRGAIVAAPPDWRPAAAIAAAFPAIAAFARGSEPEIQAIEARLDGAEAAGQDTAQPRLLLRELRWRLEYTGDAAAAAATLARLRRLASLPAEEDGPQCDGEGSYGPTSDVWFLKLDVSVDHWLAPDAAGNAATPRLLDRVNDPDRLRDYLEGLLVSRPAEDGVDRRKELNFATADLVRLILRRRPARYPWDPRLAAAILRFVARWQDPCTGFFGADYELGATRYRTTDLSLTFHMARYLGGRIGYWPQLVDTLFAMRDQRYPNGWRDEGGMTSHNNYDVAVLLRLGWPSMRADQRQEAHRELDHMLDWCLDEAIAADGTIRKRAAAESLPESYYFAIAFLDTVGFFDPAECFWTDRRFSWSAALRARLLARLDAFNRSEPMARMARERLLG